MRVLNQQISVATVQIKTHSVQFTMTSDVFSQVIGTIARPALQAIYHYLLLSIKSLSEVKKPEEMSP